MKETFFEKLVKHFNMLWFIMALGLGGTAVAGFAFLNYTMERTPEMKGLVSIAMVEQASPYLSTSYSIIANFLQFHIATFAILHLAVLAATFAIYGVWKKRNPQAYNSLAEDSSRNSVLIAPALALGMTFNVFLSGGYFYFDFVRTYMQEIMPFALAGWGLLLLYTMSVALSIQAKTFRNNFELNKIHFGWLLVPFALAMVAVSGSGIAALAKNADVAKTAFFLSLVPFSMALFLALVKMFSLFVAHYTQGLPQKVEQLPSFFMIIPITTLLAITLFRFGHFYEKQFDAHVPSIYFAFVTAGGWAFMTWYLALGVLLLKNYWKNHLFNMKYFDESQWGLICPMVAYAVLGSFVYKVVLTNPIVLWTIVLFLVLDIIILATMFVRQYLKISGKYVNKQITAEPIAATN